MNSYVSFCVQKAFFTAKEIFIPHPGICMPPLAPHIATNFYVAPSANRTKIKIGHYKHPAFVAVTAALLLGRLPTNSQNFEEREASL